MGKSSLYAQHFGELRAKGITPIAVDLAAEVGRRHESGVAWARTLGDAIAARLGLEDGYLTRSLSGVAPGSPAGPAIERLLKHGLLGAVQGTVLLILDEYDYISDLDFREEILLSFRHLQSLQSLSEDLQRISICLVGLQPVTRLGTPKAASTSPIAHVLEMRDFEATAETIEALKRGFDRNECPNDEVFYKVLALSGGQPLVTNELLHSVQSTGCRTDGEVQSLADNLVAPSGLGPDMELFVSIERAFAAEGGAAFAALRAYESLLQGSQEAHTAPGASLLLLLGLVRRTNNLLEIKGDIFRRRFDAAWTERMLSRVASGMQQYRGGSKAKGRICVINTGGTLGMVERGDRVVAPRDADEFKGYFTSLPSIAEEVEFINLFPPRDSINVFPDQWTTIARYIYNRRNDGFDGFVVAHGTDTMAYTASAVAFALGRQLRFPVVFTGAQTTPDVAYGDAHVNLYRACEVAKKEIPEVVISFGNFVYRAVRAQKKDDRRFDGFESPTYPPLAEVTGEINVRRELLRRLPKHRADIELRADFEKSVLLVPQFPGLEPGFFDYLLQDHAGLQACTGVIVQTLGAGNVASEIPYSFIPFVKRAYSLGIPVIVTSQYPPDPGSHTKYTPAEAPIEAGAIHAGNMTLAAAVTKFRWVLADVRKRDWLKMPRDKKRSLVSKLMVERSIIGEF